MKQKIARWGKPIVIMALGVSLLIGIGRLLEWAVALLPFLDQLSADNITDIVTAALGLMGGCLLERIRALRGAREQQLQWQRDDQLAAIATAEKRAGEADAAFMRMCEKVSEYQNMHNVNYKTEADKAILGFLRYADPNHPAWRLRSLIAASDPFDGPDPARLDALLNEVMIYQHQNPTP